MQIFFLLLSKILPLYLLIILGYIAGKFLHVQKESAARILIYIIAPMIVFHGVINADLASGILILPIIFYVVSLTLGISMYQLAGRFYAGNEKNILAFTSGTGNTGYFGLPVAVAIFGNKAIPIIVLTLLGTILYENTYGYYIVARGQFSVKQSIQRLLHLPAIYAFAAGIIVQLLHIHFGDQYSTFISYFQGTYSMLGMMVIGMGIATFTRASWDWLFIIFAGTAKFVGYPLLIYLVIFFDKTIVHLLDPGIYPVMVLQSIVPLAANTVAFATELRVHPEKSAMAVLVTTLFAMVYIPIMVIVLQLRYM